MITLKNYKDHKPKRISFEGVNWQDDMELLDEIISKITKTSYGMCFILECRRKNDI